MYKHFTSRPILLENPREVSTERFSDDKMYDGLPSPLDFKVHECLTRWGCYGRGEGNTLTETTRRGLSHVFQSYVSGEWPLTSVASKTTNKTPRRVSTSVSGVGPRFVNYTTDEGTRIIRISGLSTNFPTLFSRHLPVLVDSCTHQSEDLIVSDVYGQLSSLPLSKSDYPSVVVTSMLSTQVKDSRRPRTTLSQWQDPSRSDPLPQSYDLDRHSVTYWGPLSKWKGGWGWEGLEPQE